jgi:hypothetical protein
MLYKTVKRFYITIYIQWKPLIMITLGPALFDYNNRLITLSGGYKNLHYLTVLPDTWLHQHRTLSH